MAATSISAFLRKLRRTIAPTDTASVSDAELLERFVQRRDEVAFEALVWRHQRLVLGVCRRVLRDAHDAEDAFQATFLVLARKAHSLGRRQAVAAWLHKVAFRIALRARASAAKRTPLRPDLRDIASARNEESAAMRHDLALVLDEEVNRLPKTYRIPVVLCYLQGQTYQEAGRQLGLPIGTLSARLTRARALLRRRLVRRGIDLSGAVLASLLCEQAAEAAVPPALVRAAVRMVEGQTAGAVSAAVATLTEGALRSLFVSKLKIAMVLLLAAGMGLLIPAAALLSPAAVKEAPPPTPPLAKKQAKANRVDDSGDPLPDGAIRRIGSLRFRAGGGNIHNLLLTPDGKTLISNSYYGSRKVRIWELATGKLLRSIPGEYKRRNIALSPDGKLVAVAQENEVILWDLASGKEVRRLAHAEATGFAFSPDGKILAATGLASSDIRLWDVASGRKTAQWEWPCDPKSNALLAFTPDGKTLISAQQQITGIVLWDVATGKKRHELKTMAYSLALSPDGAMLAQGGRQGGIPLWDVKTGKLIRNLRESRACIATAFSPDGKTLAASEVGFDAPNESFVSLWDVSAGKELRRINNLWACSLAFSRDGKTLIVGRSYGVICQYDAATGKEVGPWTGSPEHISMATMVPGGRTLAYYRDDRIHFRDAKDDRDLGAIDVRPHGIWSLAVSPDGRNMAASVGEHTVNIWDIQWRKLQRRLQWDKNEDPRPNASYYARGLAFSPDGRLLASGGYGALTVRIWDTTTGMQVSRLRFDDQEKEFMTVESVAFSPDGKTLAASGRGSAVSGVGDSRRVRLWDVATGKPLNHLNSRLNDPADKGPPNALSFPQRPMPEPKFRFSPDGWMLAVNGWQNTIPVWEAITGRQRLLLQGHEESIVSVAFSPDGRTLASAGGDETIRLWDLETGRELRKLRGHRGYANSLSFSSDGKMLVSSGEDTTILFWDVADVTHRARPRGDRIAPGEWQALWRELIASDAAKAYRAMIRMNADGSTTVFELRKRLHPARAVEPEKVAQLLKDLDNDEFAVREKANGELKKLTELARPALEKALARPGASPEMQRRVKALLASLTEISGERLRQLRAIEVLERVGTTEARQVLKSLADGAPEALTTTAAQAALKRLGR